MDRAFGLQRFCDSLPGKNIIDLTNGNHIKPCFLQSVQHSFPERLNRIVMTVAGALKFAFLPAHIGSCNDSSHLPLISHGKFSCNFTAPVQFFKTKGFLIAADLEYRIGRGIHDHMPGCYLLLSQLIQNFCPAGAFIADHLMPGPLFKLQDQFRRKPCLRKGDKGLFCFQPHHLPVACHGILPPADLIQLCVIPHGMFHRRYFLQWVKICDSQLLQIGQGEAFYMRSNMSQGVCPCISKLSRVHCAAYPQGIYHDHEYSSESLFIFHSHSPLSLFPAFSFRIKALTASTATWIALSVSCTTGFGISFLARSWLATTRKTLPARTFR